MKSRKTQKKYPFVLSCFCALIIVIATALSTLNVQAATTVKATNLRFLGEGLTDSTWTYQQARRVAWDKVEEASGYILKLYYKKSLDDQYWGQVLYTEPANDLMYFSVEIVMENRREGYYYFTIQPKLDEDSGKVAEVASSGIYHYVPYELSIGDITSEGSLTAGAKRDLSVTIINNEPYETFFYYPEGEDRELILSYYKKGTTSKTVIGTITSNTSAGNVHLESNSFSNFTMPAAGDYVLEATLTVNTMATQLPVTETYTATKEFHVHNYGSYQSDGTNHWKVCSLCQGTTTKTAHTYGSWTIDTVATNCTATSGTTAGSKHRNCTVCNYKQTAIAADGSHNWSSTYTIDKAATCTATGSKSIHCKDCSATKSTTTIAMTSHSYGTWASASSTQHKKTCSSCGGVITASHTFGSWVIDKAATDCTATTGTAAGSKHRTCSGCGYKETAIVADGSHNWDSTYTVDVEPDCYTDGSKSIHCKECSATKDVTVIPDKDCSYSVWKSKNDTQHTRSCSSCGALVTAPHTFGAWIIDTKATDCTATSGTAAGSKHRVCSGCGYKQTAIAADGSHNWSTTYTVDKASTCTTQGSKSIHCQDCSATKSTTAIALKSHSYGAWTKADETKHKHTCSGCGKVETAVHSGGTATCSAAAVCTTCKASYGSKNATNHTGGTSVINAIEATTQAEGYTGDTVCKGCSATLEKGTVIDKKETSDTNDATTSTDGNNNEQGTPSTDETDKNDGSTSNGGADKDDASTSSDETSKNDGTISTDETDSVSGEMPDNGQTTQPSEGADDTHSQNTPDTQANDNKENETVLNTAAKVSFAKNKLSIKWGKVKNADGYEIYVAKVGANLNKNLVKTVNSGKKTSLTLAKVAGKKVNTSQIYQVKVKAFETINGEKDYIGESLTFYTVGNKNKTYTNTTKVKVSSKTVTLKEGKQKTVKASVVKAAKSKKTLPAKYAKAVRFQSSNETVAVVSKNGKIKAVGKGNCYVYAIAQNGISAKIKVKVK